MLARPCSAPVTPPTTTYRLALPAVSPFSPFERDETIEEIYKVYRYESDSEDEDDASELGLDLDDAPAPAHEARLGRKASSARLCSDMSAALSHDHSHTSLVHHTSGSRASGMCTTAAAAERRAETSPVTGAKQPFLDLDVSPSLALSLEHQLLGGRIDLQMQGQSQSHGSAGDRAGTKAIPIPLSASPPHLGIHPSGSSSRFSVGTFGPGPRSHDSDAGTLRTSSSSRRRRRTISAVSAAFDQDTAYEATISSSPSVTAVGTAATRRASFAPDEDVDAAIDSLLLDLSRNDPIRIVPAGVMKTEAKVGEFGAMDKRRPLEMRTREVSDIDE